MKQTVLLEEAKLTGDEIVNPPYGEISMPDFEKADW